MTWRPKQWHVIVEDGGAPVAHVGVVRAHVRAGGWSVAVGGVGGVVSVPQARGRRLVHDAMRRALDFIHDDLHANAGVLFCLERLIPFYSRQGWRLIDAEAEFDQPTGRVVASRFRAMVFPFPGCEWPPGRLEVPGYPW